MASRLSLSCLLLFGIGCCVATFGTELVHIRLRLLPANHHESKHIIHEDHGNFAPGQGGDSGGYGGDGGNGGVGCGCGGGHRSGKCADQLSSNYYEYDNGPGNEFAGGHGGNTFGSDIGGGQGAYAFGGEDGGANRGNGEDEIVYARVELGPKGGHKGKGFDALYGYLKGRGILGKVLSVGSAYAGRPDSYSLGGGGGGGGHGDGYGDGHDGSGFEGQDGSQNTYLINNKRLDFAPLLGLGQGGNFEGHDGTVKGDSYIYAIPAGQGGGQGSDFEDHDGDSYINAIHAGHGEGPNE